MVVTAEETRNRIPAHRSAAAVVVQVEPEAMGPLVQAAVQLFQTFTQEAPCSMEPAVAARAETLDLVERADQALVVTAELIQPDLRRLLIQEVVAVAVELQAQRRV